MAIFEVQGKEGGRRAQNGLPNEDESILRLVTGASDGKHEACFLLRRRRNHRFVSLSSLSSSCVLVFCVSTTACFVLVRDSFLHGCMSSKRNSLDDVGIRSFLLPLLPDHLSCRIHVAMRLPRCLFVCSSSSHPSRTTPCHEKKLSDVDGFGCDVTTPGGFVSFFLSSFGFLVFGFLVSAARRTRRVCTSHWIDVKLRFRSKDGHVDRASPRHARLCVGRCELVRDPQANPQRSICVHGTTRCTT